MSFRIGYVGLGNMGGPIFTNLVKYATSNNLPAPCAWNIVKARYDELRPDCPGALFCEELEEVVGRSNVVFTCLLNDPVAEEVYERLFAAVRESKGKDKVVFVDQSSLKPRTSSECRGGGLRQAGLTCAREA